MLEFLSDNWGGLLIPVFVLIVFLLCLVRRIKRYKSDQTPLNLAGLIGKILGALVFRDLPRAITGSPPTGKFQKPDFSYDDCENDTKSDDNMA